MKKLYAYRLFLLLFLFPVFLLEISSCKKTSAPQCGINTGYIPIYPFQNPVWHPNGNLVGFNLSPISGTSKNGTPPCEYYSDMIKPDSVGFYIMNKDGTGFKRIFNFYLLTPAWSPDGNWLAFSYNAQVYKIRFTGLGIDSSSLVQLTDSSQNFFPCWTADSDSLFYDSNKGTNGQGYYTWKMASNGSGKTGFPNTGRQPLVGGDGRVYFVGPQNEIYSINKDGSDQKQITYTGNSEGKTNLRFYNNNLYYLNEGWIYRTPVTNYLPQKLFQCVDEGDYGYDISRLGEFVYTIAEYPLPGIKFGTLWTADIDGKNKSQLTYNHF